MEPFETLDRRFASYTIPIVFLEKLHTGLRWAEGPVYFADQRCLLFSDLPNNRILRFDEQTFQVSVFRTDSNFSNGNTRDRQGRLVTCEHRGRRVTRTEYDGSLTVLAERYQGKRLNAPNDVVVKSDDTVWFTDPTYGISAAYEGGKAESEIGSCNVYCFDPRDGSLRVVRTTSVGRTASLSPRTRNGSTSPIPVSGQTQTGHTTSAPSRSRAASSPRAARSPKSLPAFRTVSASISTAIYGQAPAMAFTASRPMATSLGRSPFRKRSPTCALAVRRATGCTSAGIRPSMRFT